jgi:hypothetical protein
MSEDGQTKPLGRCRNEDHFALHRVCSRASRGSEEWRLRVARISIDVGVGAGYFRVAVCAESIQEAMSVVENSHPRADAWVVFPIPKRSSWVVPLRWRYRSRSTCRRRQQGEPEAAVRGTRG